MTESILTGKNEFGTLWYFLPSPSISNRVAQILTDFWSWCLPTGLYAFVNMYTSATNTTWPWPHGYSIDGDVDIIPECMSVALDFIPIMTMMILILMIYIYLGAVCLKEKCWLLDCKFMHHTRGWCVPTTHVLLPTIHALLSTTQVLLSTTQVLIHDHLPSSVDTSHG